MKRTLSLLLLPIMFAACSGDAPPPVAVPPRAASTPAPVAPGGGAPAMGLPPGHPTTGAAAALAAAAQGPGALTWSVPKGWEVQQPSSTMRRAQYRVPGAAGPGECVVFYFGPGQGGDAQANAARWASQFRVAGGGDPVAAMKTRQMNAGDVKVTLVEVAGTYAGGMGGAEKQADGYMLLGAIAEGPDANWFFKFTGPAATVGAQRAAFERMVGSLKKGR